MTSFFPLLKFINLKKIEKFLKISPFYYVEIYSALIK